MSIFQGTQKCKKSEKSDNKTGDYSSFKITKKKKKKTKTKKKKKKKKKNQKKSLCNLFGQKMESTPPTYAPSILPLLIIPCVGHSKSHFLTLVLNGKNVDLLVSEFLLCCDSSVRLFSSKCKGFRFTLM